MASEGVFVYTSPGTSLCRSLQERPPPRTDLALVSYSFPVHCLHTMHRISLQEAETRLPELIEEAAQGQEVLITRGDGVSFRIVPAVEAYPHPRFGSAKGLIELSDDFDAPLADFDAYAP